MSDRLYHHLYPFLLYWSNTVIGHNWMHRKNLPDKDTLKRTDTGKLDKIKYKVFILETWFIYEILTAKSITKYIYINYQHTGAFNKFWYFSYWLYKNNLITKTMKQPGNKPENWTLGVCFEVSCCFVKMFLLCCKYLFRLSLLSEFWCLFFHKECLCKGWGGGGGVPEYYM